MTVADRKTRSAAQVEGIPKPSQLYHAKSSISEKKKDLLQLCADGTILVEYHDYYKCLPTSRIEEEKLPEPDIEEDSETE